MQMSVQSLMWRADPRNLASWASKSQNLTTNDLDLQPPDFLCRSTCVWLGAPILFLANQKWTKGKQAVESQGHGANIRPQLHFDLWIPCWVWLKIKQQGQTAGCGPCFHIPGQPILDSLKRGLPDPMRKTQRPRGLSLPGAQPGSGEPGSGRVVSCHRALRVFVCLRMHITSM